MPSPLAKKMYLRPGYRAAALHAPEPYLQLLEPLPDDVHLAQPAGILVRLDLALRVESSRPRARHRVNLYGGQTRSRNLAFL